MAINRLNGEMLEENLIRNGVDIAFETDLLYIDVINGRIGIKNATPGSDLHVSGVATVTGQLNVDNLIANDSTLTSTVGDLVLSSTTGNVSADNKRILNCADPVGALDVVNLQTLNSSVSAVAADKIIELDTQVEVIDDGINPGFVEFTVDGNTNITLTETLFSTSVDITTTGTVSALNGQIASLNLIGDQITSDTTQISLFAPTVSLDGQVAITGMGTQRVLYVNGAGYVDSKPQFAFNNLTNTLTLDGIFVTDSITIDGTGITSLTSLELNTTANNDLTISTGTGEIQLSSTSALNLPSGTTALRPGAPATGAFRWNTDNGQPEFYDGANWYTVPRDFNITSQQIIPNGVDTDFTLNKAATTDGVLVIVNGIVQDPQGGAIYSVTGTTLSFTSVLTPTDIVSVRFLEF